MVLKPIKEFIGTSTKSSYQLAANRKLINFSVSCTTMFISTARYPSPYPGTCIGLAVIVNNVETLMYVLIEFIFCLGIPKTPTREAPEGMEPCYFHRHIYAFKQLKTL